MRSHLSRTRSEPNSSMDSAFQRIWNKAKTVVTDSDSLSQLLSQAGDRIGRFAGQPGQEGEFSAHIQTLLRMVKSHLGGLYPAFSAQTILLIAFGLLYFITPTDLIPDFIPALGWTDDIAVIYYLIKRLSGDIEAFREWESSEASNKENNA